VQSKTANRSKERDASYGPKLKAEIRKAKAELIDLDFQYSAFIIQPSVWPPVSEMQPITRET